MKTGLCGKLAVGNIEKNRRFFIPRILCETGLLACFFIMYTLSRDNRLAEVEGGSVLPVFMTMGTVIIGVLSVILIFYTNSFLMKQRKREFGLYNVLGMEKKHICRVLFYESFICGGISVIAGVVFGMLFYKAASLAICRLLQTEIVAGFYYISLRTVLPCAAFFLAADGLNFAVNCGAIFRAKPSELILSASAGEKEPKVKWPMFIIGTLSLGAGYYISLTTEEPLQALLLFFAAVMLVIAGTYFLFISGSIFVLKALKKSDGYYYKPHHITAVSGLLYRMKQNAAGLASVAVLATGLLIMISSTLCLYSKTEETLEKNYPQDYYAPAAFYTENGGIAGEMVRFPDGFIEKTVNDAAEHHGLKIEKAFPEEYFEVTFSYRDKEFIADRPFIYDESDIRTLYNLTFITEEDYINLGGKPIGLGKNEIALSNFNSSASFGSDSFMLFGQEYRVYREILDFPISSHVIAVSCFGAVVADKEVFNAIYGGQRAAYGDNASVIQCRYCVNFEDRKLASEHGSDFSDEVRDAVENHILSEGYTEYSVYGYASFWESRANLYSMYGTLLFLGILLGIVCLFATVLIIYYKQISEGYEDRSRYLMMQKIGMTSGEIKKTVKNQIMLVFFLPIVTAGIHVAFAYPILTKLMRLLLMENEWLFAEWCVIVFLAFCAVYALIYRLTAKTYYKIVN